MKVGCVCPISANGGRRRVDGVIWARARVAGVAAALCTLRLRKRGDGKSGGALRGAAAHPRS